MEEQHVTNLSKPHKMATKQKALTPIIIDKESPSYTSVLNLSDQLEDGLVHNLAVTGTYGSGKSSVLKTLQQDNPQYSYLTISLATLDGKTPLPANLDDNCEETLSQRIEYSILQQLIYREKQENLPNSRLKRILSISDDKAHHRTYIILITLLSLSYLIWGKNFISVFELSFHNTILLYRHLTIIALLLLVTACYPIIFHITKRIGRHSLRKVNVKSCEIEIENNTSILNKHLDEIIYFFQQTNYNVVLIEDLDRFENPNIFLKLRELNYLLNQSKEIGRDIFFIYAVKDDMFKDESRTKFFEYMTTIVPIIGHTNAYDHICKDLRERNLFEPFKNQTLFSLYDLKDILWYVKDKRLSINIVNEYEQLQSQLGKQDPYQLMAMVVFKNHYPNLYAELCENKGPIVDALNYRSKLIEGKLEQLNKDIEKLQQQAIDAKNERLQSEKELRSIYICEYRRFIPEYNTDVVLSEGTPVKWEKIRENEELFNELINSSSWQYIIYNPSYGRQQKVQFQKSFRDVEKSVDKGHTYQQRLERIRNTQVDFSQKINEKKKQIALITSKSVAELYTDDISQHINDKSYTSQIDQFAIPPMVKLFIQRGLINEQYTDLVAPFCDGYVTTSDHTLLMNLKNGIPLQYDTPIEKVSSFVDSLDTPQISKLQALNIEILDYLCKNKKDGSIANKYEAVLNTLEHETSQTFHCSYFEQGLYKDVIFEDLVKNHAINYPQWYDHAEPTNKDSLACICFRYWLRIKTLVDLVWLNQQFAFIGKHIEQIGWDAIDDLIRKYTTIEFTQLTEVNGKWCGIVIGKGLYELNKHNVEYICNSFGVDTSDGISLTKIQETNDTILIDKVENHITQCITTIFNGEASKLETSDNIVALLQNEGIPQDIRLQYIIHQHNTINVEDWCKDIPLVEALTCDVFDKTWKNAKKVKDILPEENNAEWILWINSEIAPNESNPLPEWLLMDVITSCKNRQEIWGKDVLLNALYVTEDVDTKILIVNMLLKLSDLGEDLKRQIMQSLPSPYQNIINNKKKFILFPKTDLNLEFTEVLKIAKMIKSQHVIKNNIRIYLLK